MKKPLYIIGAGSVGGHIACNLSGYNLFGYTISGFFDDTQAKHGTDFFGYPVLGSVEKALDLEGAAIVLGIAFPSVKTAIAERLSANKNLEYPVLIHEKAWISGEVTIGKGSIVYPGTTVNYGSKLGSFVLLNMNCALGHHTTVKDYSTLAPGVNTGGHTIIEEGVDIGIGSSTLQNVVIGKHSVIGGQAMVTRSIPGRSVAVGVPAKVIKRKGE
ncbi:MAG: NeuD/PglB/VioB family sugar acetyltransferase [Balneolaceae bacterium]|nr:NeuD/PglB/VioB family sugar acetyltransferase [Balneolaceae bacterium]